MTTKNSPLKATQKMLKRESGSACFMLSLKVEKIMIWPLRIFFIILAFFVGENIVEKVSQGYVISTGSVKYAAGTLVYYTTIMKFLALDILLVFLAFRTSEKNDKNDG